MPSNQGDQKRDLQPLRKMMFIGLGYQLWGAIYLIICGKMINSIRLFESDLIGARIKILEEAFKTWKSGNMAVENIIFLSRIIGILGTLTIGLTLIIIGSFFIWPGYKLPKVHLSFSLIFILLFCYDIWIAIKYVSLGGIFGAINYALVLYYAWYSKRQEIKDSEEKGRAAGKLRRWLFYFMLVALVICSFIPIVLNLKLPEGVMVEID